MSRTHEFTLHDAHNGSHVLHPEAGVDPGQAQRESQDAEQPEVLQWQVEERNQSKDRAPQVPTLRPEIQGEDVFMGAAGAEVTTLENYAHPQHDDTTVVPGDDSTMDDVQDPSRYVEAQVLAEFDLDLLLAATNGPAPGPSTGPTRPPPLLTIAPGVFALGYQASQSVNIMGSNRLPKRNGPMTKPELDLIHAEYRKKQGNNPPKCISCGRNSRIVMVICSNAHARCLRCAKAAVCQLCKTPSYLSTELSHATRTGHLTQLDVKCPGRGCYNYGQRTDIHTHIYKCRTLKKPIPDTRFNSFICHLELTDEMYDACLTKTRIGTKPSNITEFACIAPSSPELVVLLHIQQAHDAWQILVTYLAPENRPSPLVTVEILNPDGGTTGTRLTTRPTEWLGFQNDAYLWSDYLSLSRMHVQTLIENGIGTGKAMFTCHVTINH